MRQRRGSFFPRLQRVAVTPPTHLTRVWLPSKSGTRQSRRKQGVYAADHRASPEAWLAARIPASGGLSKARAHCERGLGAWTTGSVGRLVRAPFAARGRGAALRAALIAEDRSRRRHVRQPCAFRRRGTGRLSRRPARALSPATTTGLLAATRLIRTPEMRTTAVAQGDPSDLGHSRWQYMASEAVQLGGWPTLTARSGRADLVLPEGIGSAVWPRSPGRVVARALRSLSGRLYESRDPGSRPEST